MSLQTRYSNHHQNMDTQIVTVENIVSGGNYIGSVNGKKVFFPGGIPGETVEISLVESKNDYCTARLVSVINPSPYRVENDCPAGEMCGGCNMRHIETGYQQQLRSSILQNLFLHKGIPVPAYHTVSGKCDGYRCRVQLHTGGLVSRHSNRTVQIHDCPVATPEIRAWLRDTPPQHRPAGKLYLFGDQRVLESGISGVVVAAVPEYKQKTHRGKTPGIKPARRYTGTVVSEETLCKVELSIQTPASVLKKQILFDVRGFFQSNLELLEKTLAILYKAAAETPRRRLLDMYCGAGTFSVFLADIFDHITLVEHNRDALAYAEQNLAGKPHSSYGISGETWVKQCAAADIAKNGNFDAAVIDPPRSGMEETVRKYLADTAIPYIFSISCDPVTHARDCSILVQSGYQLQQLYFLDFYPQTSHIESLAILKKL